MSNVLPLSTTRVTDALTRQRVTDQIQRDQNELFRLQNQISTGRRVFLPSDDASASQRAMALQRTLERKEQSSTNLQGATASLVTTEAALADVSTQLSSLNSEALGVIDTVATDEQRDAVINTIDRLLLDLQRIGNSTLTETYLLGGAETVSDAYSPNGPFVEYNGDESAPQTYVDIGYRFNTATSGDEVLGGLSEAVRGFVDLQPQTTPETRLSQINGGLGVSPGGSISLRYDPTASGQPTETTTIDLGSAATLGDVARLIEAAAPSGADLTVEVVGGGLRLSSTTGTLAVGEVADGVTAQELGILTPGVPTVTLQGGDLDPTLAITDRLDDLAGVKARGRVVSGGADNDLVITATANGAAFNGVTVEYVAGAPPSAAYDDVTNTLTVEIVDGVTTAQEVAEAITAEGTFVAEPDYRDQTAVGNRGVGTVSLGASLGVGIDGGGGTSIDLSGGLRITNGGESPYEIDTAAMVTVEDLLNQLNRPEYGLDAGINTTGDGIDVRSRRSGADLTIGENGGTTATDLGIRTYTDATRLDDFNRGRGVIVPATSDEETAAQNDLRVTLVDAGVSTTYDIDVTSEPRPVTVGDLRTRIEAETGGAVTVELATVGNGLVLRRADVVDPAAPATGTATVAGDTLTITADTPGAGGDRPFTLEVIDGATGGLSVNVTDDAIVVDLGGTTPDTATIAAAISLALPDYTVAAPLAPSTATAPEAQQSFAAVGGHAADAMTVSGDVAERLGFFTEPAEQAVSSTATLGSDDRHTLEVDSVFNTLLRMREALEEGDSDQLGREMQRLDDDLDRVNFGRAEVGVRLRTLEDISFRLQDEEITLRDALSREIDADLAEVISEYNAQQASLEASLRVSANLLSMSILDFI